MKPLFAIYYRLKLYLVNVSWIFVEKLVQLIISFAILLLLARSLGPELYGHLGYALSLISLFAVVGHVGLSGVVQRRLVLSPNGHASILGWTLILKFAGYFIVFALLLVFTLLSEELFSLEFWLIVALSLTILLRPFEVISFWFQSRVEAKYITYAKSASLLFYLAVTILLVVFNGGAIAHALAYVAQVLIFILFLIAIYSRTCGESLRSWRYETDTIKSLFSEGWIVFLGSIFAVIYLKIDQVMLKWLADIDEVGRYVVAVNLSEAWYFLPAAIVSTVFPRLVRLHEENEALFQTRLQQVFDLLFLIAFIGALVVAFTANPLVSFLFGTQYSGTAEILVIHIWAAIFIFLRSAFSKWIIIKNLLFFSLITQGLGALANVALNLLLIPQFAGVGAAYATLISYAIASYFSLLISAKTRPVFYMMSKSMVSVFRYGPLLFKSRSNA